MNKTTEALKHSDSCYNALRLAEEALRMISTFQEEDNQCDNGYGAAYVANEALAAIREALAEQDHFADPGKPIDHIADTGKMIADPVKQEPVAWWDTGYCVTMSRFEAGADWIPLYANTFDIEALTESRHKAFQSYVDQVKADRELSILQARLEALEEAAKVCEQDLLGDNSRRDYERMNCAAAIRSLK